jgi:hypothetical protein
MPILTADAHDLGGEGQHESGPSRDAYREAFLRCNAIVTRLRRAYIPTLVLCFVLAIVVGYLTVENLAGLSNFDSNGVELCR